VTFLPDQVVDARALGHAADEEDGGGDVLAAVPFS
jgi:hypothetical protein